MVDIIIPAYNAFDTIGNALSSILKQVNKDALNVYIINDGSDKSYIEYISIYKDLLNVQEIIINNSGPGGARQVGIDVSNNEYIVFLDADDILYNEFSIVNLLNVIVDCDLAQGKYIEKRPEEDIIMSPQYCYMHGKMYRRSIIDKYKIKFDSKKREHGDMYEDSSFNQLYSMCCEKIKDTDEIVYIYNYNERSLTRFNENKVQNLYNFVDSMSWLADEVGKRNISNNYIVAWNFCIISMHAYFNHLITIDDSDFVYTNMKKIKKIYVKYIEYLPYEDQLFIYKLFNNYQIIPQISFYDFIKKIK